MRAILVLSICVSILIVGPAWGATWYVDDSVLSSGDGKSPEGAFKSIQEGIDASSEGDTVIVEEGIYVENIKFKGKNIVLTSTNPLDPNVIANTILDGNQAGSVVTFAGTETEACILSGFTIRNGDALCGGGILGGSESLSCRTTIENNTITANCAGVDGGGLAYCNGAIWNNKTTNNSAEEWGGGLAYCDGTIQNNTISGNHVGESGGGLASCAALIQNNTIARNSSDCFAGGLFSCSRTVQRNTITGNSAASCGGGLFWCDGTVQNNTIAGNWAGEEGGGLYWCDGTIRNNVITGNYAGVKGGGMMFCCGFCGGKIQNNTITENSAGEYGGGLAECKALTVNSIIWANTAPVGAQVYESNIPTYSCIQDWGGGGEGNIVEDPLFLDPDGPDDDPHTHEDNDYRLSPSSSCIDAGINQDGMWDAVDLDGNPRIWNSTVDMGVYEFGSWFRIFDVTTTPSGEIQLTWNSRPGEYYTIFTCADIATGAWVGVETVASEGTSTTWTHSHMPANRRLFYRVDID